MNFPTYQINSYFEDMKPLKGIFSIWGNTGVGKTTFALQTAIKTAKVSNVLFLYSKPSFPYIKLKNLVQKAEVHLLEKIDFLLIADFDELRSSLFNLEFLIIKNFKKKKNLIKLIIIDSITDLYHLELDKDKKDKNVSLNYQLNQILAYLTYLITQYDIEFLIINEVSRKNIKNNIKEVQSGGKVMDYWVDYSIKLTRTKKLNARNFIITKHPKIEKIQFSSYITEKGFK